MALSGKERQKKYRERLYEKGLMQVCIWVPKKSERLKNVRKEFFCEIEELTAGWPRVKLTKLFNELLIIVKKHKKEGKRK